MSTARILGNDVEDVVAGRRSWLLMTGNALDLLAHIEDDSIHCSISSPPYLGLRVYRIPPQIWTHDPRCEHEWSAAVSRQRIGWESTPAGQKQYKSASSASYRTSYRTCNKCAGWFGHLGNEAIPDCVGWARNEMCAQCYICHLRMIYAEIRRVLRPDGTCFVNLGDSYKDKQLLGIPWRFALALQSDGWYLRSELIWDKPSAMCESVKDRCTKSHEHIFMLAKSKHYFFDHIAIREKAKMSSLARMDRAVSDHHKNIDGAPGQTPHSMNRPRPNKKTGWDPSMAGGAIGISARKNRDSNGDPYLTAAKRTVWNVSIAGYKGDHFAVYPVKLVEPMIAAGTSERGCCTICGRPWIRVVRKGAPPPEPEHRNPNKRLPAGMAGNLTMGFRASKLSGEEMAEWREAHPDQTTGWRPGPGCDHYDYMYRAQFTRTKNARKLYQQFKTGSWFERARRRPGRDDWPVIKPTILDPFAGTGTTLVVALRMGRAGIGLELGEQYAKEARNRIIDDMPLFNTLFDMELPDADSSSDQTGPP